MSSSSGEAAEASFDRPAGKVRGIAFVIVLTLVTLGVYAVYWTVQTFREVGAYRGQGLGAQALGIGALVVAGLAVVALAVGNVSAWEPVLLGLVIVVVGCSFLLPSYVGRMYVEAGLRPAITGWSGLWSFVPYVGTFIWLARIQSVLNRFWSGKASVAP